MKEYEQSFDKPIINLQALFFIVLIIGAGFWYLSPIVFPKEKVSPIIKNESTAIQIVYINVTVTPTPDGKLYYASEYQNGIRKISNKFSFYADNASGFKRMYISSTVFNYKTIESLHWFNPTDYKYYSMVPHVGYKYLIVYYAMWMDDRAADNTQFHIPKSENFVVQSLHDSNRLYYPIDYPAQLRFAEMEDDLDYRNKESIQSFGQHREYTRKSDGKNTAGEISVEDTILRAGLSNTMSGYKIYEIPDYLKDDELIAGINFYAFGDTWWRLKP